MVFEMEISKVQIPHLSTIKLKKKKTNNLHPCSGVYILDRQIIKRFSFQCLTS